MTKTEPEANSDDAISQTSGTNMGCSQRLYNICASLPIAYPDPDPDLNQIWYRVHKTCNSRSGTCRICHLSWKSKMPAAALLNFEKCQYLRFGWRYFHQFRRTDASRHIEMIA